MVLYFGGVFIFGSVFIFDVVLVLGFSFFLSCCGCLLFLDKSVALLSSAIHYFYFFPRCGIYVDLLKLIHLNYLHDNVTLLLWTMMSPSPGDKTHAQIHTQTDTKGCFCCCCDSGETKSTHILGPGLEWNKNFQGSHCLDCEYNISS